MCDIVLFRRDFRLDDNQSINYIHGLDSKNPVIYLFILDPNQCDPGKNKYFGHNVFQFMVSGLDYLTCKLGGKLSILYGNYMNVISKIHKKYGIGNIAFNGDVTPYSIYRDRQLIDYCNTENINCYVTPYEPMLYQPGTVKPKGKTFYQKFTPMYKEYLKLDMPNMVEYVVLNRRSLIFKNMVKSKEILDKYRVGGQFYNHKLDISVNHESINKIFDYVESERDERLGNYTTQMASFLKFGIVSIRKMYNHYKNNQNIRRSLIWRDFYYNIVINRPEILKSNTSLKTKYDLIEWDNSETFITAWEKSNTGYPVVDACMKCLTTTGWLCNRGRLIVASFLVKVLGVDWKIGEKIFAKYLVDYDPIINNGNWQWISGSGADSQPYFRVFNPKLQSQKFDPGALYIKKWLPKLSDIDPKDIHNWETSFHNYKIDYPPIINYTHMKNVTIDRYRQILTS